MKSVLRFTPLFPVMVVLLAPCAASAQAPSSPIPARTIMYPVNPPRALYVVTGEPVSYEISATQTQLLADGTHITRNPAPTLVYRDSLGRTHTEHSILGDAPSVKLIEIDDPVAGFHYALDTQHHVAYRFAVRPEQIIQEQNGPASAPLATPTPSSDPNRPQRSVTSLGSQVIDGISVDGRQTTTVYPVGLRGNDRPMTRACEDWRSAELHLDVLSTCSDPQMGEDVRRLTNITRAEPDPALFQIPAGYSIVDTADPVALKLEMP
jgi:hypothetical protein